MASTSDNILQSRTFQFYIGPEGPDRKPFNIHTAVVEKLSEPLAVLMNGWAEEAKNGVAYIKDIDEQTFLNFCEFAYWGDYAPSKMPIDVKATSRDDTVEEPAELGWDRFGVTTTSNKGKKDRMRKTSYWEEPVVSCKTCGHEEPSPTPAPIQTVSGQKLWDDFRKRQYCIPSPKLSLRQHLHGSENDSGPLFCHAHVYVFADRYKIPALRTLALDKLHQALRYFELISSKEIGIVVELIRYSYDNENTRDNALGEGRDELRVMVLDFVGCVFETLVKDEVFLELAMGGGLFARDLMILLGKRF